MWNVLTNYKYIYFKILDEMQAVYYRQWLMNVTDETNYVYYYNVFTSNKLELYKMLMNENTGVARFNVALNLICFENNEAWDFDRKLSSQNRSWGGQ